MLNKLAKLLLVATSLAPLLGAVAINQYAQGNEYAVWLPWLMSAILLAFICWGMLSYASKNSQKADFFIKEFESNDKEIIAFLLTYLLPFLTSKKLDFSGEWLTGSYIICIIFFTIAHADAFHFNPVMGLFGYHFYKVKDGDGMSYLLITQEHIRRNNQTIKTVQLAHNIRLQVKG